MAAGEPVSGAERALEGAIMDLLAMDAEVADLLGDPLRVMELGGPRPAFPYLEVVRHQSEPTGSVGVEASEHRVDIAVVSRDVGGMQAKEAMAAVRVALSGERPEMEDWTCVLLFPMFADIVRQASGHWRALLRLKAVVEAA